MSTRTPSGSGTARGKDGNPKKGTKGKKGAKAESVPFWKRDLSSMRSPKAATTDEPEHPPFEPRLPRVNLLPDSVRESIAAAHLRRRFVFGGALIVVVAAVVWVLQIGQIQQAELNLQAEQDRSTQLTAQTQALGPVIQLDTEITSQREFVQRTLASQPLAASVITALVDIADGAGIDQISSLSVIYHGIPAAGGDLNPCPRPDPFTTEVTIGCITFAATAPSREEVAALLTELEAYPLFVGPYVTSTQVTESEGDTTVGFSGTVGVSPDALAVPLTAEELEALTTPPPPAPSASPSPEAAS